ncbi:MAG: PTS sugar transporter subunit IIA [Thermoguttaceae bacterium]|nr:PTS sugar transporter subunit IIA [Thermoguttaceae bacterium]MDW8078643.1 PTS sugar transporter subunit IIA [Thermoguttaceae bacterium]
MRFSEFIVPGAIRTNLQAEEKEAAIREMVKALVDAGVVSHENFEGIVKAILRREELGSTGIWRGIAVPHTKHPGVQRVVGMVAISRTGVDFNSLDGERVHLFFLLVSPPDRPGDHLRALEHIARQLRDETFTRVLKQAQTPEEVQQLLQEADNGQPRVRARS